MTRVLIILTLALGPLQWITLANAGLSLKPVHIPFFLAAGIGWTQLFRSRIGRQQAQAGLIFGAAYTAYLTALMITVAFLGGDFALGAKYIIYFLGGAGWFFALLTMDREKALLAVYRGGVLASVLFVGVAFVSLQAKGINMFDVIGRALTTGNPALLQFMIFKNLFNDLGAVADEDSVGVAMRHTSMGFIYIGLLTSIAFAHRGPIAKASATLALLIILVSVSRSLWVAVFLSLLPALMVWACTRPRTALVAGLATGCLIGLVLMAVDVDGLLDIFEARFGAISEDGRIGMYDAALGYINAHPITGYGLGREIAHGGVRPHQVHNLFLGAWHQAGLPGLLSSLTFTGVLLVCYVLAALTDMRDRQQIVLLGLMVLPVFRSQISGSGGNYTLPEWICLALVLALVIPESLRRRAHNKARRTLRRTAHHADLSAA